MRDDRLYIHHVLQSIYRIQRYTQDGKQAFLPTELIQDAVLRNLQTLAESTKRMSEDLGIDLERIGFPELHERLTLVRSKVAQAFSLCVSGKNVHRKS